MRCFSRSSVGDDARLAEGLVCDFVRPATHPVGRLAAPAPTPASVRRGAGHRGTVPPRWAPAPARAVPPSGRGGRGTGRRCRKSWSFFGQRLAEASLLEPVAGIPPPAADGPGGHAQHLGCLLLGHLLVPDQVEDLPFLARAAPRPARGTRSIPPSSRVRPTRRPARISAYLAVRDSCAAVS